MLRQAKKCLSMPGLSLPISNKKLTIDFDVDTI